MASAPPTPAQTADATTNAAAEQTSKDAAAEQLNMEGLSLESQEILAGLNKGKQFLRPWADEEADDSIGATHRKGCVGYVADTCVDLPRPSRAQEPRRPLMEPPKAMFWEQVDIDLIAAEGTTVSRRQVEVAKLKKMVDVMLGSIAIWKQWGIWANAQIDVGVNAGMRAAALVQKLRDTLADSESAAKAVEEGTERMEELSKDIWECSQAMADMVDSVSEQIASFREKRSDESWELVRAKLVAFDELKAQSRWISEATKLASEREAARKELEEEKKKLQKAKQLDSNKSIMYKAYHDAMLATASEVQDPKYFVVLGWHVDEAPFFVQNPGHPYWRGQSFAKYLEASHLLVSTNSIWCGAHERKASCGLLPGLLHPYGVIDSTSYWAGIRHRLEGQKVDYCSMSWTRFPENQDLEWYLLQQV